MNKFDVLVVGGGFRSIVAAWGLARQGEKVALVEVGAQIGGFMSPINWDGFIIDKGPQFFDNFEPQDVELVHEILGSDIMEEVGFEYGSFTGGTLNCDFAIPDWQALGEDTAHEAFQYLFKDRVRRNGAVPEFNTLDDVLVYDGGPALYPHLIQLTQKFVRRDAADVSPRAAS
ncbi:MAG: NAD(P)-binding protein, partial [Boseongicola sp.]